MGQGQRFKLAPWQKRFIRDIYEPHRMGRRVVRRAILSIARKNGKTALIATLALAHLIGPEAIPNGEIYSAANDRDQAAIVFKFARQIVEHEPELLAMIEVIPSTKTMIAGPTGSIYRAISAEAGTKHGYLAEPGDLRRAGAGEELAISTTCSIPRSAPATSRCSSPSARNRTTPSTSSRS